MDKFGDETPLTDVPIKRLKPSAGRYAVSDGWGLALEGMPSGAANWRYRYLFKGKTEKVSLRPYPMLSLKEARTKRDEMATLVFRGESPARHKQLEKVALANASTVRDFSECYFAEIIQKDRKDATQLRRYLVYPAFGSVSMRDVTAQDVQRLVFASGTTALKPPQRNCAIC